MTQTRKPRRKRWAVSVGVKGRNRVRVYEHVNGRLYLAWQGGSQPLVTDDRLEAVQQAEAKAKELLHRQRKELTLGALFDMYLEDVAKHNTNYDSRVRSAKLMRTRWGENRLIKTLSLKDTNAYVRERMLTVRARSVQEDLEGLRAAINWAMQVRDPKTGRYVLDENPLRGLTLPRELNVRRARLEAGEYEAMLAVADSVDTTGRFRLALVLAFTTGHRLNSVRQLRWIDVDQAAGTIFWAAEFQKNGIAHRSPFSTESPLAAELTTIRARYPNAVYVFETVRGTPRPLERESFYSWWREGRLKAKLPKKEGAGWHMFRRELASDLSDTPLALVKELMGSKNPHVLLAAYQEPRMEQLRTALETRKQLVTASVTPT